MFDIINIPIKAYELSKRMKLVKSDDTALRKELKPVETPEEMQDAMAWSGILMNCMVDNGGSGLAANQVGCPHRMFVMNHRGGIITCINPEIVAHGKERGSEVEGCISFPGLQKTVERWRVVMVKFFAEDGPKRKTLKGFEARCFQHELDHLDGICIDQSGK